MTGGERRSIGLLGATSVGVGAIVGGGIIALTGVAFATTGPGAILAFALNGVIAIATALSFAEMSSRFPESGGAYTYAKKLLSMEASFGVGWVVWFSSIVAGVLYAAGFAVFALAAVEAVWNARGGPAPAWLTARPATVVVAALATLAYAGILVRRTGGGGAIVNVGKVIVFAVLVVGGLVVFAGRPTGTMESTLRPFLSSGMGGLLQAMGFTFIALQGFDLIAAVAGEVKTPGRTIPRAMLLSLGIALAIYLPFLFVLATVGASDDATITEMSRADPEVVVADAARNMLGPIGYWTVIVAGILSMLTALEANLLAASRIAHAMARDRTLPHVLERVHVRTGAPVPALGLTALVVIVIVAVVPDVASAGAAASLIFLVTFALVHGMTMLARRRGGVPSDSFRTPLFPLIPALGGFACLALAIFQGVAVPAAGSVAALWLGAGTILFILLFARRARIRDATAEALDPELMRLRGRAPLVLVPVANPATAAALIGVANALAPRGIGRVLLLSVVTRRADGDVPEEISTTLSRVQATLGAALCASVEAGRAPEALTTIADAPWPEIVRVARTHDCESVLLGLSDISGEVGGRAIEDVINAVGCDTIVLRAVTGADPADAKRVLVPVGGRGGHDVLRARFIGNLTRTGERTIHYVRVIPVGLPPDRVEIVRRALERLAREETRGTATAELIESDHAGDVVIARSAESDLVVLGLQRPERGRRLFGPFVQRIAAETRTPMILISRRA